MSRIQYKNKNSRSRLILRQVLYKYFYQIEGVEFIYDSHRLFLSTLYVKITLCMCKKKKRTTEQARLRDGLFLKRTFKRLKISSNASGNQLRSAGASSCRRKKREIRFRLRFYVPRSINYSLMTIAELSSILASAYTRCFKLLQPVSENFRRSNKQFRSRNCCPD